MNYMYPNKITMILYIYNWEYTACQGALMAAPDGGRRSHFPLDELAFQIW